MPWAKIQIVHHKLLMLVFKVLDWLPLAFCLFVFFFLFLLLAGQGGGKIIRNICQLLAIKYLI